MAADTQVLARWNADGTNGVLLGEKGPAGLSQGIPHGLRYEHDAAAGEDYLYHANNEALLFKTTTAGELVSSQVILWLLLVIPWPHFDRFRLLVTPVCTYCGK